MNAKRALLASSLAAAALAAAYFVTPMHQGHAHAPLAALERTYVPITGSMPLAPASFVRADGSAFPAAGLEGRWTLLFFGFTSCPDVCPTALQALSAVARDPASGVAQGSTQIVFVSTDPTRDTPDRIRTYLGNFDARIVGLHGSADALRRFTDAAGAGYAARAEQMDHSTSIYVVDPGARVAGVLLRSADPARVVADFATLRDGRVPARAEAR